MLESVLVCQAAQAPKAAPLQPVPPAGPHSSTASGGRLASLLAKANAIQPSSEAKTHMRHTMRSHTCPAERMPDAPESPEDPEGEPGEPSFPSTWKSVGFDEVEPAEEEPPKVAPRRSDRAATRALSIPARGPNFEAVVARLQAAKSGNVGTSSFDEVASCCSSAFEAGDPKRCTLAIAMFGTVISKASQGAMKTANAASAVGMALSVLRHPNEECRRVALNEAAKDLDMMQLLRAVLRGLGGSDASRRWQACANALQIVRFLASRPDSLEPAP